MAPDDTERRQKILTDSREKDLLMTHTDRYSARFANLELDGADDRTVSHDAPTGRQEPIDGPSVIFPVADVPNVAPTPRSGVSQEGKARAQADEKAAEAAGFSLAPPVYEIGCRVNQLGVDNFRASRAEYDEMPTAVDACERLADLVAGEQRQDLTVEVPSLVMAPNGDLSRGNGCLPVTERALLGLAGFITPGGGRYLRDCPANLRAYNINHWLQHGGYRVDAAASKKAGRDVMVPRELTLRTRQNHTTGKRENFATVGPRYTAFDIDKIAEMIMRADAIPADAKADVVYDGYKARIDVLFHTDIQPEKAVAGEIFKAGILVKTADDGTGSIQVGAQVWRNLCLNLIIIDTDVLRTARKRHTGKVADIQATVRDGIGAAMEKIAHFADAWSSATVENVLDKYGTQDVDAVFRGLVANKVVHVAGVQPRDMFDRLMGAWQAEPGYSRADIVNAVTRAAHTESWRRWTDVEDLERTGGELLFARNWDVAMDDKLAESLDF